METINHRDHLDEQYTQYMEAELEKLTAHLLETKDARFDTYIRHRRAYWEDNLDCYYMDGEIEDRADELEAEREDWIAKQESQ